VGAVHIIKSRHATALGHVRYALKSRHQAVKYDVPDLQKKLHAMGRHGPVSFALAGIDIALWYIAGKAKGEL